ncbi:MAG: sensor histidine kinase [Planctomycetes bacterium]|nr:sensor histidine kinase [Planctomycetota bacterium]
MLLRTPEGLRQLLKPRLLVLALVILTLTFVHQSGVLRRPPFHQILDVVPYLPIILGGLWYGIFGGVTCAILTSMCYVTHLCLHEGGSFLGDNLHKTLNILMFNVVGVVTGYLAQKQLRTMARYQSLAEELERSYDQLRQRTEELIRSEEQLQRATRLSALGELTAGLAHEIGNPLGGIKGAAEILADGVPPEDPKHRFARLLLKEVGQLDQVVARFLNLARPPQESDGAADAGEVLQAVVSLCNQPLKQGRLDLRLSIEERLPPVAASPSQLQQVLLNLLLNAIQATGPSGRIALEARRAGDAVQCVVTDTGRGIAPEDLPRIFDPFFTTRQGGTGLGLAITHRIVESCRGRIHVESRPGGGTTFTVTLPVRTTIGAQAQGAHR